jgi:hypothetical protein
MRKIKAFIALIVLCMSFVTLATADNNTSVPNVTVSAIATTIPVATGTVTQPAQTTVQPTQTVTQPAQTAEPAKTEVKEKKFRIGPTVRIRPLNDVIKKDQDGLIEIYFDNSGLNDYPLTVEARISVPSGIHVYGEGFGSASAAGIVSGTFEIPPGSVRTINVAIKSEKVGDFSTQFTGVYYPGDNKDMYQPISLTAPFRVLEASKDPNSPGTVTEGTPQGGATAAPKSPGISFFGGILIVSILAYTMRRK